MKPAEYCQSRVTTATVALLKHSRRVVPGLTQEPDYFNRQVLVKRSCTVLAAPMVRGKACHWQPVCKT